MKKFLNGNILNKVNSGDNSRMKYLMIILIFIILVLLNNPALANDLNNNSTKTYKGGSLKYIEGIPYLQLSGSYYEMGLQYGYLLKDEMKVIVEGLDNYTDLMFKNEPFYIRLFAKPFLRIKINSFEDRIPERYREELKGMALTSEISYKKLLFIALLPEIAGTGCTTILKRIDNKLLLARNLDYQPVLFGKKPVLIKYNPENKNSFISVGVIAFPGVLTGLSQKGLGISLNQIDQVVPAESDSIPIGYKNREILEECSNLKEVDSSLENFRPDLGWLISVISNSDNEGNVYNISSYETKKSELGDLDNIFATNYFLSSEMNKKYLSFSNVNSFYNMGRYNGVKEQLETGINSIDSMIGLLGSSYYGGYDNPELGLMHYSINNEGSIQSVLINLEGEVYFSSNPGYSGSAAFYKYNLEEDSLVKYKNENQQQLKQAEKFKNLRQNIVFESDENSYKLKDYIMSSKEDLTVYELSELVKMKKEDENIISAANYEEVIIKISDKYNNLPLAQIWKARLLLAQGKKQEGIRKLNSILMIEALLPSDRLEVYKSLAITYADLDNKKMAINYAQKVISMFKEYQVSDQEEKEIEEMQNIINKLEV